MPGTSGQHESANNSILWEGKLDAWFLARQDASCKASFLRNCTKKRKIGLLSRLTEDHCEFPFDAAAEDMS